MNPSPNLGAQKQFNQKFEDFSSSSEDESDSLHLADSTASNEDEE